MKSKLPYSKRGISNTIIALIALIIVVIVVAAVYVVTLPPPTPPKPQHAQVSLTIWHTYAPGSAELTAFNQTIAAFEAAYPYITLNVEMHPFSSAQADFVTASLANKAPDVLRESHDWTGALVAQGFLAPIDPYVNATFLSNYFPVAVSDYQYNGKTWGLPENINFLALVYNKALVPTPPATTDDLIRIAQNITVKDSTGKITTAGIVFPVEMYWFGGFLTGFGGSVFDSAHKPTMNSTAAVNAVNFINDLIAKYQVMPVGSTGDVMSNLFNSGHAGMIIDGPWDIGNWKKAGINYGIAPLPTVTATGMPMAPFIGSQGWVIASGKNANVTEAAFLFIAFVTNFDAQKRMVQTAGDLPANQLLAQDSSVTGNPDAVGYLAQAARGSQFPNFPQMGAVWGPVDTAFSSCVVSDLTKTPAMTPRDALNKAEKDILTALGTLG